MQCVCHCACANDIMVKIMWLLISMSADDEKQKINDLWPYVVYPCVNVYPIVALIQIVMKVCKLKNKTVMLLLNDVGGSNQR